MRLSLGAFSRHRPRALTVVVLLVVAALLVLANLSFDARVLAGSGTVTGGYGCKSYGWPLVWHRYLLFVGYPNATIAWYYSPARLAANGAMWLAMLLVPALACEWLLRRYRPRLRWSLRTMLAAVALTAGCCAWFATARGRANVQEPLITEITARGGRVMFDRQGPKWLDLFDVDPLRRRLVGASFSTQWGRSEQAAAEEEAFLKKVGTLPELKYLRLDSDFREPRLAATLAQIRQLRVLGLDSVASSDGPDERRMVDECLAAVDKMSQLEELSLSYLAIDCTRLPRLGGLMNLKTLRLQYGCKFYDPNPAFPSSRRLPPLPYLERIDLSSSEIGDEDLPRFADLPALRSLNLTDTEISDAGLRQLASFNSLEELQIDLRLATAASLKSLVAVEGLKKLHIEAPGESSWKIREVKLDHGSAIYIPNVDVDDCLLGLQTLRRERPDISIDGREGGFDSIGSRIDAEMSEEISDKALAGPASWLPTGPYPWVSPSAKAFNEKWLAERGIRVSF